MEIAIWIIAIVEIIRMAQNAMQLWMVKRDSGARDDAYKAFVDSLKDSDMKMVHNVLAEIENRMEGGDGHE